MEGSRDLVGHRAVFSSAFLEPHYPEPEVPPEGASWVIVRENGVYVLPGTPPDLYFPAYARSQIPAVLRSQYLGHHNGVPCYAAEVTKETTVPGGTFHPRVRELFAVLPEKDLAIAALAVRIIEFDRTTRFCGQCGSEVRQSRTERAKICDACGLVTYPRTSPAIIVLVRRDDRILLARSPHFPPDLHSVIAGFVEPYETLEEAVHREVREEIGIEITNVRYVGSEPWPFPNSLMIGFVADYAGGDITIDNNEIVAAGWFDRDHLPTLPLKMSISRALVEWWIGRGDPGRG